ncbi:NAD-binding protein [Sulfurimonas sp. SAG-AH-194-C20]|nr:NAD-binding protein [Sulfurimonas sp. SAG-AH-194-C20]MDF1879447.1 NAD-binding protein [Sulfurimonas sp. SAG-AH-194-C20]
MSKQTAFVFGYNQYAFEILENLKDKYTNIKLYSQEEDNLTSSNYEVSLFDLSDDWSSIEENISNKDSIAFCTLEDDAQNIFLTISLRAYFDDLKIIAIASNKENANKLTMAGANKVIPIVESTADIITNILELPISNTVLHSILFEENDLKIAQIVLGKNSSLLGEKIVNVEWESYKGINVLALMNENMSHDFIYALNLKQHTLSENDTLIVVGYEKDIQGFKKLIGSEV